LVAHARSAPVPAVTEEAPPEKPKIVPAVVLDPDELAVSIDAVEEE
jgi:hypothetical protein